MTDLTDDYIIEAREHLDEMETHLLQLEQSPEDISVLNNIFTDIHTIKGAAQFTGLARSSELAHRVEDLLDFLRQGQLLSNAEMIDVFIASRDRLAVLVNEVEQSRQEESDIDDLVERLNYFIKSAESENNISEQNSITDIDAESDEQSVSSGDIETVEFEFFLDHVKAQLDDVSVLLNHFEVASHCQDKCQQLTSIFMTIGDAARALDFKKTLELSEKIVQLLLATDAQNSLIDAPLLKILQDVSERMMILLNELELFQLEASPVHDLINKINDLHQDDVALQTDIEDDIESDALVLETFLSNSKNTLSEFESDLLSLENADYNHSLLVSMSAHLAMIQMAAQPLNLAPIDKLCQHTVLLLEHYANNELTVSLPLMELLSEIEVQLLMLMAELESSGKLTLSIDSLLENIQLLNQFPDENDSSETIKTDSELSGFEFFKVDLSGESYVEEYDQELFEIFLQQMQEKLQILHAQLKAQGALSEYKPVINSLKSSANYMGYQSLIEFYQNWLEHIDFIADSVDAGKDESHEFMYDYIEQLQETFPQLELPGKLQSEEEFQSDEEPQSDLELQSSLNNTNLDEEHLFEQLNQTFSKKEETQATTEDDLFTQLSQALESSVSSDAADETIHELFDEILTETEYAPSTLLDAESEVKSIVEQKPQQKKSAEKNPLVNKKPLADKKLLKQKKAAANKKVIKKSVRVDANKIDTLMNQVGELIVDKGYFHQLFNELRLLQKELKENAGLNSRELKQIRAFSFRFAEAIVSFGRTSNDLQEGVMKVRMLPIAQLFDRYPRLIHDLVHHTDKKVNLEVRGEETELDKMIIEEISDPLIHLIRNAVDHGIETTKDRQEAGKQETATLLLEAYNESNHIVIEITDDGCGIDPEKIKAKALEKELYSDEELARMSQKELTHLILLPGFSTAEKVSNTSGRGVGMDVVKKNIEKLNGILEIDSKPGIYTKMRLKIPLTLAIIRALQVRVGNSFFTIPLSNVEETLRVYAKDTSMMEGTKVIHLRGKTMPIIYLSKLFNIASDHHASEKFFVVTVNTGMQQIGLIVDELLGQAEVVIKPLVDYLQEKSGFSGATIIGDGKISLILDIYELVNMTTNKQVLWQRQQTHNRASRVLEETQT